MKLRGPDIAIDFIAAKKPVITISDTARTLNEYESGSIVILDRAAGNTATLPANPTAGTTYDFYVYKTPTSNQHKIITGLNSGGSTLSIMVGALELASLTGGTMAALTVAEGSGPGRYVAVNMNVTTTGGQYGSWVRCSALSAGTWFVQGLVIGSSIVTPMATS